MVLGSLEFLGFLMIWRWIVMGNGTLSGLEGKPGSSRSKTNRQRSVLSQLFNYVYYNYWESNWSLNFQISATSRSRSSKFELPLCALLLLLLQVVVALQHRGTKTTFKIIKPTRIPHAETTIDAAMLLCVWERGPFFWLEIRSTRKYLCISFG